MRESDTFQAILDEGEVRGLHRALLALGGERFGKPDRTTRHTIEAITDLKRLHALLRRLLDATSWSQLLGAP
jgi:hypothetical protein